MALMKVLNENGEWVVVQAEPIDHTHTPDEAGADASGSAAQALSDAKSYTDSEIDKVEAKIPTVSYPVTSVNGKTGAVSLTASDVGADIGGSAASALDSAKDYTDSKIDALVGEGASTTLDTIGEISAAIEDNQDMLDTLNAAIGNKANASNLTTHTDNTTVHITSGERTAWNAKANQTDLDNLSTLVGGTAVSTQINNAVASKLDADKIIIHNSTTSLPSVTNGAILIAYDA